MKKRFNKLASAFICIAFAVFMLFLKDKVDVMWGMLCTFASMLTPFIYGFAIAYIVNFPYRFFRTKVFGKIDNKIIKKLNKPLSLIIAYLLFFGILSLILALIIPQIAENINNFVSNINVYTKNVQSAFNDVKVHLSVTYNVRPDFIDDIQKNVSNELNRIGMSLMNYDNINKIFSYVMDTFSVLFAWFMAIIISVYMLASKERLGKQIKKFCAAFLPTKWVPTLYEIVNVADDKCGKYLVGKMLDSVIYGLLCFIGMSIFNLPYAPLISVIVGVFNVIPFFGPFIGAVIGALILLLDSPNACLIFVIISVVLQQLDGNFIGPKIVGNQVGLIGFWSLFSVVIGGAMFGVPGMILGTPIFAALYTLVGRKIAKRVAMKGENADSVINMQVTNKSSLTNVKAKTNFNIHPIKSIKNEMNSDESENDEAEE